MKILMMIDLTKIGRRMVENFSGREPFRSDILSYSLSGLYWGDMNIFLCDICNYARDNGWGITAFFLYPKYFPG